MTEGLMKLSEEMAGIVANSGPSIVRVNGRRRHPASGIVWSADGLIITANHVVRRDKNIMVGLANGETAEASLIGRDPSTDLALLKVAANDLAVPAANENPPAVGQLVLAVARPGRSVQATMGIISAVGRRRGPGSGDDTARLLHTDVLMYPGFSGGALVGADGRLLGLNTSGFGRGVSLTVPFAMLERVAEALQAHGRVRRGYLGISTQRARLPEEIAKELGQKAGLLITSVEPGSPGDDAGLTLGDTLVSLGGKPVQRHRDLMAALGSNVVGQKEVVNILRGGQIMELTIKIGERN